MTSSLTNAEKRKLVIDGIYMLYSEALIPQEHLEHAKEKVLRRYPDPKEPTLLRFEDGSEGKIVAGRLHKHRLIATSPKGEHVYQPWYDTGLTVSDCLKLGEIAQEAQQGMDP